MLSNIAGGRILSTTVTASNFAGPPLILVGDSLTSASDVRWTAMETFADRFGAPLIGIDYAADVGGLDELDRCLSIQSRFFSVSTLQPFTWCGSKPTTATKWTSRTVIPCGPLIAIATDANNQPNAGYAAWLLASRWAHAPANNRYGAGMQAIGPGDPEGLLAPITPPVFSILPDGLSARLTSLWKLWAIGIVPTETQVQTLMTEDLNRPGLARRFNASLVGVALLYSPLNL